MTQQLFDGEINREWSDEGLLLDELPERVRRAVAKEWMEYLVPSFVGSDKFEFVTQGRSVVEKKGGRYFSTCGELAMTALYVIGYRGKCLNRNLEVDDGGSRKFIPGRNMSLLMGHLGGQSSKEGAWVKWVGEEAGPIPQTGDIVCVTEGPSKTEHVMVTMEAVQIDDDEPFDAIRVAEAGRGYIQDQNCGFGVKEFHGLKVGSRTCVGFVDIGKLKLTAPAKLPPQMA
jgi:hypothetical protein